MPKVLFIKWSDLHSTNIPIIDEQHRGIVETINSLYYFMRNKQASEIIMSTIAKMEQYAYIHFLTEENLLKQAKYPDFETHKKLHKSFRHKSLILSAQLKKTPDAHELLSFLKQWWIDHINVIDQKYASCLHSYLAKKSFKNKSFKK